MQWKAVIAAGVLVLGAWIWTGPAPDAGERCPGPPRGSAPRPSPRAERPASDRITWLAIGGGSSPELNQVSIEQDVALASTVLGSDRGLILFAGGPGSRDVQVLADGPGGDPLLRELGLLIAPRGGREGHYRKSRLALHGATTYDVTRQEVEQLVALGGPPLTLYIAGHGERGQEARDNWVGLWGGTRLTVGELGRWLAGARRDVRLIVTACYGGGFAELTLALADRRASGRPLICGLFATTHDLPASGCDPNPDRQAQQGYAMHFFNALQGRDRAARPLPPAAVDFDGDGRVSMLEAHGRARIASRAADVPTTSAEAWLRRFAPLSGPRRPAILPEERAVIAALARLTGQRPDLPSIARLLRRAEERIKDARDLRDRAANAEDEIAREAIIELLQRWPVLDDPWHPDFAPTIARHRVAITEHLRRSKRYARFVQARRQTDRADATYWEMRRRTAPLERLGRALENVQLAERLKRRGGRRWARYQALLACERGDPDRLGDRLFR